MLEDSIVLNIMQCFTACKINSMSPTWRYLQKKYGWKKTSPFFNTPAVSLMEFHWKVWTRTCCLLASVNAFFYKSRGRQKKGKNVLYNGKCILSYWGKITLTVGELFSSFEEQCLMLEPGYVVMRLKTWEINLIPDLKRSFQGLLSRVILEVNIWIAITLCLVCLSCVCWTEIGWLIPSVTHTQEI